MNLSTVRTALVDTFATTGLRAHKTEREDINPPALMLELGAINYVDAFGGEARVTFNAIILLSGADVARSIEALDDYLTTTGDYSLVAAVEADPTLGGLVESASVTGVTDIGRLEVAGTGYVGARVTVDVLT